MSRKLQVVLKQGGREIPVAFTPPDGDFDLTKVRLIVAPGYLKKGMKERPSARKAASARRNGKAPCRPGKRRGRVLRWTDEIKKAILAEVAHGDPAKVVAERHGVNVSMLSRWRSEERRRKGELTKTKKRVG